MFVTGGGLRIDYLITRDGKAMNGLIGGNAIYSAVGAKLWTEGVTPWARRGDNYPKGWLKSLTEKGLSARGLVPVEGIYDHRTFFAYTEDGERVDTNPAHHYARINQPLPPELLDYTNSTPGQENPITFEPLALRPSDWPETLIDTKAVHLAPMPLSSHLQLPQFLRDIGVDLITLDPGERYMIPENSKHLHEMIPLVDIFIPSEQELKTLFGKQANLLESCRLLSDWGAKLVVTKLGDRGVAIYEHKSDRLKLFPAIHESGNSQVVDVTGAGDAFCGGFLAGMYLIGNLMNAISMGSVSASIVVEGYGALYALEQPAMEAFLRLSHLSDSALH